MKNETSGEAAYAPKIGELVTIRDEVDKTDKGSPLHITLRYVAAGMREGYRQARAGYTPPASDAEELAETCDRLDLAHENEKLREVLEKIAATDTSPSFPDFLWLQRWRNETKDAASKALKGEK